MVVPLEVEKMRILMTVLCVIACYAGSVSGDETPCPSIPAEQAVIQFDTKLGVVTFLHQMHADLGSTQCTTCHHTFKAEEGPIKRCHECHGKDTADAPKAKTAFHTRCIGCHEYTVEQGDQAGPLKKKCKLCHIK
jgi:hypothetical protein